jgi:CHASE2 domain-containing sensor protein/predicted Ser/Thr protein kinase
MSRARRMLPTLRLILLVGSVASLAGLGAREGLQTLERSSIDARFGVRGDRAAPPEVAIVALDNRSLRRLDVRPPISRRIQARLIDRLDRASARVVAFDFSLEQPSGDRNADRRLAVALMNARHSVAGIAAPSTDGGVADLAGFLPFRDIEVLPGYTPVRLDPDGVVRRFASAPGGLGTFPIAAAQAFRGSRIDVPSDALIDYPGSAGTVPQLSYVDVLDGDVPGAAVRGRIVIVAPTATVLGDTHHVPVDSTMSGAEIHAAAMATALDGFPLRTVPDGTAIWVIVLLGFAVPALLVVTAGTVRRLRGRRFGGALLEAPGVVAAVLVGVVTLLCWLVVAQLAFDGGTVLPLVAGVSAIVVATVGSVLAAAELSRRERRAVRLSFAANPPPLSQRVLASAGRARAVTARDLIAGYTIESLLGSGGMGAVWSAKQSRLNRDVAVKVIRGEYATDPAYRRRFVAEAYRASAITHPHVVPVLDAGDADGVLYIAMLRIDGVDLMQLLRDGDRMDAQLAVELLHPVACALDHVYAEHDGLVHRDVKPSNVLVPHADPGHTYLLDFGVAITASEAAGHPWPAGTKPYLAPERWAGGEGRAADVYALAATLYECMTSQKPFPSESDRELRRAHEGAPRPRITDRRPDLPEAIDAVIATGLACDPLRRHPTAVALTTACAAVLATGSVRTPAPHTPVAGTHGLERTEAIG